MKHVVLYTANYAPYTPLGILGAFDDKEEAKVFGRAFYDKLKEVEIENYGSFEEAVAIVEVRNTLTEAMQKARDIDEDYWDVYK